MIQHVLFDADGVLQSEVSGWTESVFPHLGERSGEFLTRLRDGEGPALCGRSDRVEDIARLLAEFGVSIPARRIHSSIRRSVELVPSSIDLVHRLRRAGYGVHLGSNQERHRAAHMRGELGFDALFDVSCYSYELGVAKPDPGYFVRAAEVIGAPVEDILFIDDLSANVRSARTVGMPAEQWTHTDGLAEIERRLAGHGIRPAN